MAECTDLSRKIFELLFLDVSDCLIYAGAIVEQADYFVTRDGYLYDVVNGVFNPGAAKVCFEKEIFEAAQRELLELSKEMIGVAPEDDRKTPVVLPQPLKPKALSEA
jgi:hypothetical protein